MAKLFLFQLTHLLDIAFCMGLDQLGYILKHDSEINCLRKSTTMKANITIMSGDGVGPEITREAVKVLQAIGSVFDHNFSLDEVLFGGIAIDETGTPTLKKHNRHVKLRCSPTWCCRRTQVERSQYESQTRKRRSIGNES